MLIVLFDCKVSHEKKKLDNVVDVLIVGGGPAGLMAADKLSIYECKIHLIDRMPTIGRKFLMAGKSGLNITTAKNNFLEDYGESSDWISPMIKNFGPTQIIKFCKTLGQETFVGSSARVFPKSMKTSPLLRSWLKRLKDSGVQIQTSARWINFGSDTIKLPKNNELVNIVNANDRLQLIGARAVIFAFGGASWSNLGSDGKWSSVLKQHLINPETSIVPFTAANMGVRILWSKQMIRFEGQPVKAVALKVNGLSRKGEFTMTKTGLEGGIIYLLSTWQEDPEKIFEVDLLPDLSISNICLRLNKPRGRSTISNFLRKTLGLKGVKFGLLREFGYPFPETNVELARTIKNLKVKIHGSYPLDFAISTKGGISKHAVTAELMLKDIPGVFCAGEMLDWTAPTGGSLLTGCLSTGLKSGKSVADYLGLRLVN